nr:3-hydroxyacyl-CoA dehydrogenase NAD-binding domain-containing protein [Streptomyces samsunensis]
MRAPAIRRRWWPGASGARRRRGRRGALAGARGAARQAGARAAHRGDGPADRGVRTPGARRLRPGVEAVAEGIDVKRGVFADLDRVCAPGAVLATSTSSLPVIECAMATRRPEDVIGMHFFNPAPVMRLVEVVHTVLTSKEALGTAHALAAALGKRAVDCPDRAGFIVNALLFPYLNSAVTMLDEGWATADDIDTVMAAGQGYPMGPLRLLDVIGLDVSLAIQRTLHGTFRDPALTPARHLQRLVEAGHLGRKGGRGLHLHER